MKFSIKDFFCKFGQIHRKLQIWSHWLKKSLMENFIFCTVIQIVPHFSKFKIRFINLRYIYKYILQI